MICDPSLVGTKGQCRSCKHIFVITDLPAEDSQGEAAAINWVFSCPKCAQLFEGSEAMRGKRGKCHACGEVFTIDLHVADEPQQPSHPAAGSSLTPGSLTSRTTAQKPAPSNSFDSFEGELTLDAPLEDVSASKPVRDATSSGTVVTKAAPHEKRPIQFNCKNCKGRMEVPGVGARQLTHCPHCKRQQTIPAESEPTVQELTASDPWNDLGSIGGGLAAAPQANPFGDTLYPPPMPMTNYTMSSGSRRRSDSGSQFLLAGIFVSLCAVVALGLELLQIVVGSITLSAGRIPNAQATVLTIQVAVAAFLMVLSLLQLAGGIAMARRRALSLARTGAIICCLPCVCLVLNIPFGIWAAILTFGSDAEREFG